MRLNQLLFKAFYLTLMITAQIALSFLMNVTVITALLLIHLKCEGLKATLFVSFVYSLLMGIIYGFGFWVIGYFYIYPLIIFLLTLALKISERPLILSLFGFITAFVFGFFFSIQDSMIYQIPFYIYYLRGLPFDLIHGLSNFFSIWVLYPLLVPLINSHQTIDKTHAYNNLKRM